WEVNSTYGSTMEYLNGKLIPRNPDVNIKYCWASANSSSILIANSERLAEDKITLMPIAYVAGNSEKLAHLYSILVKQYALTKEAYNYNEMMKKNTEKIGGIFDSQPSELKGNIICVSNPKENVIGWISAGTVTERRLFIGEEDKPKTSNDWMFSLSCSYYTQITPDSVVIYL